MNKTNQLTQNEIVIEAPFGWLNLRLKEIWTFRELLFFLIWRDVKVRYKQTALGALWAIIQPIMSMVIFSVIFGKLAKLPSDGIPYPIFSYVALLPWQLFSKGLGEAASSLTSNQNLITKTYFPRIFLPAASVVGGLVDFGISFLILLGMMFYYDIAYSWRILLIPLFLILALFTSMAAAMWLSALNVRFRDIKYLISYLIQFWMYATPVAYSSSLIPEKWKPLYGLNPMAGVIDGFRWAMLNQDFKLGISFWISLFMVLTFFIGGLMFFQRTEKNIADLV